MSEAVWWEPDEVILDAVLDGRVGLVDMDEPTQSWVVARFTEDGYGTGFIADVMACSQRHVKRIRARVLTQQMRRVLRAEGRVVALEVELGEVERRERVVRRERDELRGLVGG